MVEYYAVSVSGAIKDLNSSEKGLSKIEAEERLRKYGNNELEKKKKTTPFKIFIGQFKNALILLLVFAGILSLVLGEYIESIAIFVIIFLNTILGFVQEYRAEKSIEALEKISAPTAKVIREGIDMKIPAREVVPGDIIVLDSGDIVPADARLIEVCSLQIDEASLTGESLPSKKTINPYKIGTSVADQENMAFMSTVVTYGKGKAVVTATGMKTELGKIATSIQSVEDTKTPLQVKFEQLAKQIGIITVFLVLIVLIMGTINGTLTFTKMLIVALALTVATIPNSLPLVVTLGLSIGAKELSRRNMLIKKLPAAESLGAVTIIVSDKTGTITKNQMTITDVYYDSQKIKVSGTGYLPEGNFSENGKPINPKQLELLLRIGHLCNDAKLVEDNGKLEIIGDPTEGSLIVLGKKGKLDYEYTSKHFKLIEELPFDSDRKRMSVIYQNKISKKTEAYVKGAPDLLLKDCDRIYEKGKIRKLTPEDRKKILDINNHYAESALRVLAIAFRELPTIKNYSTDAVEKNLVFVGLVGMIDPPRDEVKLAIEQCRDAGIDVMVITGDHALTTKAIASNIGLYKEGDIVLTGDDLEKMTDNELEQKIDKVRIIARALPIQKSRIVDALQKKGHIVAMTGDGVNDAPALKKADIGISMGITGTDVAKEVSETTLLDDNFASIVKAIETGRNIYDTLIRSARFFLSCNAGEIISVLITIFMGLPLPLLPLQILMMNMLTDNFPAIGLGFEAPDPGIMKRPPRNPKEKPITNQMFASILIFGIFMGIGTVWVFTQYAHTDLPKAQTAAFTTLVLFQMFAVVSSRSLTPSIKKLNIFSNLWLTIAIFLSVTIQLLVIYIPSFQAIFGTVPLSGSDWLKIIAVSSIGLISMEISKFVLSRTKISSPLHIK